MLFNSALFFLFFPAVTVLYFLTPHRFRWALLLGASCYFYSCFIPIYLVILFYMIAVDYTAGRLLETFSARSQLKKLVLGLSLASNLGVLFLFKYLGFFSENLNELARVLHWNYSVPALGLILPLGLSFHTFQSISYVIEVYRGNYKAERHLGIFALYIMFYPQLAAGPIERPSHMLPQLHAKHEFDYDRVTNGLKLMCWGFFQKLVIADRVALYVNQVYGDPQGYTSIQMALATFFFAFQIYCDFAGYTDIARGASQVMGFQLVENFKQPYLSTSIADFWRRWHISLSSWFRDYVYIPLGGSRAGNFRWAFSLFITFLLSGLWHGAAWTFVLWGAVHGVYMLLFARVTEKWHPLAGGLFTFLLVCSGWIFFRAENIEDAYYILTHLGGEWSLEAALRRLEFYAYDYAVAFAAIALLLAVHFIQRRGIRLRAALAAQPALLRWPVYYAVLFVIWLFGATDVKQFIYFQF